MVSLEKINILAQNLNLEHVELPSIFLGQGVIKEITEYLKQKEFQYITIVVDNNTYEAAGNRIKSNVINEGIEVNVVVLTDNEHQQVIADEQTLVELFTKTSVYTDVYIAVGSGTIHDITRFCAYYMKLPFISVPTAASVDGFTSKGAPVILKGVKKTLQTSSPIAVFADTNILANSPKELTAAGFGDMIAKYTSLIDWKISAWIANEPYNQQAADITKASLQLCVDHREEIADRSSYGLEILMKALIESGLVMLLLNYSRPASGAEHHLSHYWEMSLLEKDKKQLLHGAKVGVASTIIINEYKNELATKSFDSFIGTTFEQQLKQHWPEIMTLIDKLPSVKEVAEMLSLVHGPSTVEELGLEKELVLESLQNAHTLRERCTGLFLLNTLSTHNRIIGYEL
ncbi:sn-glycerol-1-phosphate dehydrogenase [Oceanobacillus kimchii]|uniref:sn-glycerol-1-phosphate dehydrogenase n=1 Tax=Oceanobacillus kimchii TaxID=746691 RepID=UPI0021A932CA|nr:sn-glycerol-1-phosphate dehydrogenase [Oceanobacillus kimchii]MCT1577676.1 sn-glycerol-1-phosphate dehydrogenase [Oceanobacillus kimchii]MCT2136664.1 sn-glycerol-1-phosphate dehydrogenase [Oceanobacillus kimchii]